MRTPDDHLRAVDALSCRGFIKELRIYVPWTRLQSRPIEIKFKTVEIIITPITHTSASRSSRSWLYSRTRCGIILHSSSTRTSPGLFLLLVYCTEKRRCTSSTTVPEQTGEPQNRTINMSVVVTCSDVSVYSDDSTVLIIVVPDSCTIITDCTAIEKRRCVSCTTYACSST